MRLISAYLTLLRAAFRADLQYRANIIITLLGTLAWQTANIAFIWVILDRFGNLGGWSIAQIGFLYSLRLTAHGVWSILGSQLSAVDEVMQTGEYDRYLVRPLPPLMQMLVRRVRLATLGDFVGGVALLVITASALRLDPNPATILYIGFAVLGGAMIEGAVQIVAASFTFRTLNTAPLQFAIESVFAQYGNYPFLIFPALLQVGLTVIFPLAFVAYFPSTVLLGRTGELIVPAWIAWGAPMLGLPLIAIAGWVWSRQSRGYQSSGT